MTAQELIDRLNELEDKSVLVFVEAPIYKSESQTPYRWPKNDFCIKITGAEEEFEEDGESILLKSCLEGE